MPGEESALLVAGYSFHSYGTRSRISSSQSTRRDAAFCTDSEGGSKNYGMQLRYQIIPSKCFLLSHNRCSGEYQQFEDT